MIGLAAALLAFNLNAQNNMIQSDCTPAELKSLKSSGIINQFVLKGQEVSQDCTPLIIAPDRQILLVAQVFNTSGGYESYLAMFERKNFGESSIAIYKSSLLGFDMFPVQVKKANRLLFVHPNTDKAKIVVYLNIQVAPNSSRLSRWELTLEKPVLNEITAKSWMIEAGVLPKIYDDRGTLRALMESRSVEL